jgi:hypothetical protein
MGMTWDGADEDGMRICQDPEFWRLIYEVLEPGGYVAAFSSPRTGHWQAVAMEMAGFIMHPQALGGLLSGANNPSDSRVFFAVAFLVAMEWWKRRHSHPLVFEQWPVSVRWAAYTVFFWTVVYLGTYGSSQFIYFQF